MMFLKNKAKEGFTLIEIMVAVSIFAIIMTASMGTIVSIINANKKAQTMKSVMNNLNFALQSMSRDIRFGNNYTGGESELDFMDSGGVSVIYKTQTNPLDSASFQIVKSVDGGTNFLPVTAPEVKIKKLNFSITTGMAGSIQPKVRINIIGYLGNRPDIRSVFNIQTTVSQRVINR